MSPSNRIGFHSNDYFMIFEIFIFVRWFSNVTLCITINNVSHMNVIFPPITTYWKVVSIFENVHDKWCQSQCYFMLHPCRAHDSKTNLYDTFRSFNLHSLNYLVTFTPTPISILLIRLVYMSFLFNLYINEFNQRWGMMVLLNLSRWGYDGAP